MMRKYEVTKEFTEGGHEYKVGDQYPADSAVDLNDPVVDRLLQGHLERGRVERSAPKAPGRKARGE